MVDVGGFSGTVSWGQDDLIDEAPFFEALRGGQGLAQVRQSIFTNEPCQAGVDSQDPLGKNPRAFKLLEQMFYLTSSVSASRAEALMTRETLADTSCIGIFSQTHPKKSVAGRPVSKS